MGQFALRRKAYSNEDQRWIGNGGQPGLAPLSIVLDISLFDLDQHPGYIPSGVRLGRVEATGLYGPYSQGASDGREDFAGYLFTAKPYDQASPENLHAALFFDGVVVEPYLPEGPTPAPAKAAVAGHIKFVTDIVAASDADDES